MFTTLRRLAYIHQSLIQELNRQSFTLYCLIISLKKPKELSSKNKLLILIILVLFFYLVVVNLIKMMLICSSCSYFCKSFRSILLMKSTKKELIRSKSDTNQYVLQFFYRIWTNFYLKEFRVTLHSIFFHLQKLHIKLFQLGFAESFF